MSVIDSRGVMSELSLAVFADNQLDDVAGLVTVKAQRAHQVVK
jgi:hypothetical protein